MKIRLIYQNIVIEDDGKYIVTFDEKALVDGTYVLKIEDPAGNNVKGDALAVTIETVSSNIFNMNL